MTARTPLPDHLADGPFTTRAATGAGVSPGRLRAADLECPFQGVRVPSTLPRTLAMVCRAYKTKMSPDAAFSHSTAAALYGVDLPRYLKRDRLHVTVQSGLRPPSGRGVTGHELDRNLYERRWILRMDLETGDLVEFPVLSPAPVIAQLATTLLPQDLVAAGDWMVRETEGSIVQKQPLATIEDLQHVASEWGGLRGARALHWAVPRVRVGSRSRPESLQRLMFEVAGLPEPELNVTVTDEQGNDVWMGDHSWAECRVLNEYEGELHRLSRSKFRGDITRREDYVDAGWTPLRSHADDVFEDPNPFIARLWRRMVESGWRPRRREPRRIVGAMR